MAKTVNKPAPAKQSKALAVPATDLMSMMAADAGSGMEGTDRDSFAIPFIRILQQLSPQCTPGKTGYIKGAKPGMIFNTVTGELTDGEDGVIVIQCAYQRRFIQWGARSGGGGYKGEFMPEDIAARISEGALVKSDDDGQIYFAGKTNAKKDDFFSDTRSHFVLVLTDDGPVQALLPMASSQIKKSKQLMGILAAVRINGQNPPTWMSKIRLTTVAESNDSGSWWGVRVEADGFIADKETYEKGKAFHDMISSGKARVDYHEPEGAAASDAF